MPMLACIAIYIGVAQWNSWFDVSLYSKNGAWDNLQIILYRLLNQATGAGGDQEPAAALCQHAHHSAADRAGRDYGDRGGPHLIYLSILPTVFCWRNHTGSRKRLILIPNINASLRRCFSRGAASLYARLAQSARCCAAACIACFASFHRPAYCRHWRQPGYGTQRSAATPSLRLLAPHRKPLSALDALIFSISIRSYNK